MTSTASQMLTSQLQRHPSLRAGLKKILHPVMPGWVDEGRRIVQGPHIQELLQVAGAQSAPLPIVLNAGAGEGLYSPLLATVPGIQRLLELDPTYNPCFRTSKDPMQRFLAASLTTLPLRNRSVDLILCSEVLEHIPDDGGAIDEIARVLSPGGWLLASVPTLPAVFDPAHVREGYLLSDLSSQLEARGFEIIKTRFCMYALFKFVLWSDRRHKVPHVLLVALSWLDRLFPVGRPMDLLVLARKRGS